jgi:hypothetical protein
MESISIKETEATPGIEFNPEDGQLTIKGRSHPENAKVFYNPIITWCEEYVSKAPEKTTLNVQLEHFNTMTSKSLLDVFRSLRPIKEDAKELMVKWFYEADDEELLDAGLTYQEITGLDFEMIPY